MFQRPISRLQLNTVRRTAVAACALMLGGCAVAPSVQYRKIASPGDVHATMFDAFALQQSHIRIDGGQKGKTGKLDPASLTMTSIPVEYEEFKLGVEHADAWGVRTNLNLKKFDNTDMVQEAGTEVVDNRVELITKVGGILVKAAGLDAKGLGLSNLPMIVRPLPIMVAERIERDARSGVAVPGATIDFGALPRDAQAISALPLSGKVSAFVYAACRSATVRVSLGDAGHFTKTVKISDPRYFQLVNFPVKGKITAHSECGVSVTTDKDPGTRSGLDIAEALVTQAIAIKEAIAAAKESEK
ncbi:hypothetical protein [Massilia rubra]|uniref:Uncharacterized protein n=1 Tax=Massilia rubra TaxID=2607910 RepID=A0ABX0LH45_9BURK|nr:hypothetical protein [Massilia rubra]NHZ33380.1 hypothetical protein [Massilia rubra]